MYGRTYGGRLYMYVAYGYSGLVYNQGFCCCHSISLLLWPTHDVAVYCPTIHACCIVLCRNAYLPCLVAALPSGLLLLLPHPPWLVRWSPPRWPQLHHHHCLRCHHHLQPNTTIHTHINVYSTMSEFCFSGSHKHLVKSV